MLMVMDYDDLIAGFGYGDAPSMVFINDEGNSTQKKIKLTYLHQNMEMLDQMSFTITNGCRF